MTPVSNLAAEMSSPESRRTAALALGLVVLVTIICWPSLIGRIQYAKTRAELAAIRDAATGAELAPIGKLFTTTGTHARR